MKKENKKQDGSEMPKVLQQPSEASDGKRQIIELDFSGAKLWEEGDEEYNSADYIPEEEVDEDKLPNTPAKSKTSFIITGEDLLKMNIEGLPYLVEPIIPLTGVVALAGSSDTGKSSFLRQLGMEIVTGKTHFLGFSIKPRFKNVIYVSTEDDANAISFLLQKQLGEKPPAEAYRNLRYIFDTDNILKKLDQALTEQPADCVIIDTFTDMYGDDMNSTSKVRSFINGFSSLASKHNTLAIFNHHTGKGKDQKKPSKDNLLGSQGFEAKMRLVIELRKDVNDPSVRHLCIVKGNYIPGGEKDSSYVLEFDSRMMYKNLNKRVKYVDLASPPQVNTRLIEAKAVAMKIHDETGKSSRAISEELKKQGYDYGKSTIAEWVKNRPVVQKGGVDNRTGQTSFDSVKAEEEKGKGKGIGDEQTPNNAEK